MTQARLPARGSSAGRGRSRVVPQSATMSTIASKRLTQRVSRTECRGIQDIENNHLLKAGLRYVLAASQVLLVPVARKVVMR